MLPDFFNASDPSLLSIEWGSLPFFQSGAVFLGYLVLGVTGFGSALIIVPLLAWQWPLTLVVPLVLMTDIPTSLLHTGLNFRDVAWREIPRLLPSVIVGAYAGSVLLQVSSGNELLAVLGLYISWVGIRGLRQSAPLVNSTAWPPQNMAGFFMGMVETMFGTAGPIVMLWLAKRLNNLHALRATMPITILVLSTTALASAALAGNLNRPDIWKWFLALLPSAFLGIWSGHLLARRFNSQTLKPIIFSLLGFSGVLLFLRALLLLNK